MKLLDYIRGTRKGKEAHRLQKEAMQDPFLADAMDGYDRAGENQEQQIEALRRRITAKAARKQNHALGWSVAASLLIGVCLSSYFLYQNNKLPEDVFMTLEALQRDTVLNTVPQIPQLPVHPLQVEEGKYLAGNARKDSAQLLLSRERRVKKMPVPVLEEEKDVEAKRSEAVTELPVAAVKVATRTKNIAIPESASIPESVAKSIATVTPSAVIAAVAADSVARKQLDSAIAQAKKYSVRGRMTDESGEPIVGAAIAIKGTNKGTVSDENGRFILQPNGNKEIIVNYIGYEPVVLPADTNNEMLIAMNQDKQVLDEVVVVGYGSRKKPDLTGAVVAVEQLTLPQPLIGKKAYRKYLRKNLIRPVDDECAQVIGEVVLTFHVNESGRPFDIKVKTGLCPSADKEAVRLVEAGPDWTTGSKEVTLVIRF